ncbi:multidrug efflux MFS transporter, partial [Acinetobacter nosocomialis]|uniref:multidrug efflux MFS transporter n=1 Tax=Acinetobacter nosocomialis TaxID=106654 RepID=UPI0013D81FB9
LLVLALAMRWLPRHKHAAQRRRAEQQAAQVQALLACVLGCCYWRDGRARTDALLDLGLLEAPLLRTAMLVYLCVPGAFMGANLVAMLYL